MLSLVPYKISNSLLWLNKRGQCDEEAFSSSTFKYTLLVCIRKNSYETESSISIYFNKLLIQSTRMKPCGLILPPWVNLGKRGECQRSNPIVLHNEFSVFLVVLRIDVSCILFASMLGEEAIRREIYYSNYTIN